MIVHQTVDEKDRTLREVARNIERLEQAALQKDIEIREKADELKETHDVLKREKEGNDMARRELEQRLENGIQLKFYSFFFFFSFSI